jgi:nucleotide-binding universal stress UspA family protein
VTLAVVMGRRGHGPFGWFLIGAILGPLALPVAWRAIRDETSATARPLERGVPAAGTLDVLVGIDGSDESARALRRVVDLVGPNMRRLTIATVVTFDEGSAQARQDEQGAIESLDTAAASVPQHDVGRVLLTGRPDEALVQHATENGFELLAIGRRGRGASKAILGSTAARVADGRVPVLIV